MFFRGAYKLKAGDEARSWRTFSEISQGLRLTRGAVDQLVIDGVMGKVSGKELAAFLADAGFEVGDVDALADYYDVTEYLQREAVSRLTGEEVRMPVGMSIKGVKLTQALETCSNCRRELPPEQVEVGACIVCNPREVERKRGMRRRRL